jgi:hypothetical protein
MSELEWNPRYVKYARAHGKTSDEMIAHDRIRWPGGSMCGYILWTKDKMARAKKEHPEFFICSGTGAGSAVLSNHVAYDAWLEPTLEEVDGQALLL